MLCVNCEKLQDEIDELESRLSSVETVHGIRKRKYQELIDKYSELAEKYSGLADKYVNKKWARDCDDDR